METVIEQLDNALLHMKKTRCQQVQAQTYTAADVTAHLDNDDLWDLSYFWTKRKQALNQLLRLGHFCFSPARCIEYKPGKYLHSFRTVDALVLKAMALAVQPRLPKSPLCCSYKGFGGVKRALLHQQPLYAGDYLLKTDIADYYATIDHVILLLKLADYLAPSLLRLIYHALKRLSPLGATIEIGLARGSALSHVLGNFYLHELDVIFFARQATQRYIRCMDDVLIHTTAEGALKRADKTLKKRLIS
jgi:hypothetical protein